MINRTELKNQAKATLKGNWDVAIVYMLLYSAIISIISFTGVGALFSGVFTVGYISVFMMLTRGRRPEIRDFFAGCMNNFVENFVAGVLVSIFTALWSLLFFIPGIIKALSYSMTFYILNDNPGMNGNDAITESRKMMEGHKMELFLLSLSFLGWMILSMLTFGILLLYVTPYMEATRAAFYEKLKAEKAGDTDSGNIFEQNTSF